MPYSEETYFKALRLEIVILQDTLQDRLELARDAQSALSAGTVAPEKQDIERKRVADWLADARHTQDALNARVVQLLGFGRDWNFSLGSIAPGDTSIWAQLISPELLHYDTLHRAAYHQHGLVTSAKHACKRRREDAADE